jgi:hypothetical protein
MIDLSAYEKFKKEARKLYENVDIVFCPALNHHIVFNAEGFNHIVFKTARKERDKSAQILRFKLLPLAVKLLKITTTFQEFEENFKSIRVKDHKRKVEKISSVKYWGIIAIIDGRKIKVIIRQIGDNGRFHFWSIVPAWTTNKYRDIKFFTTMKGVPEED